MTAALVDRLRALPAADRARILGDLSWREKAMLGHLWSFWLRPDEREPGAVMGTGQMPPASNWIFWVCQGGRGSGKSTAIGAWFDDEAQRLGPDFVGAIVCSTVDEARKLIDDKKTGFVHHIAPRGHVKFEPSVYDGLLTWKNGAQAYVFSADKPAKARAGNFNRVWIDDPPKFGPGGKRFLDTFLKAIRVEGHGLRIGIATTPPDPNDPPSCPELLEWILDQQHAPQPEGTWAFSYAGSSDDNLQNLDPDFARMLKQFEGRENEDAERAGIYVKDGSAKVFRGIEFAREPVRVLTLSDGFDIVTVSIDPADSSNTKACEVGIVVGGLVAERAHAFLVEDASGHMNSDEWPARAWDAAEKWASRARRWRFIIEVNRGTKDSSLLRSQEIIRRLSRGLPGVSVCEIRTVTSREDKGARAAPLPLVYRAGQVKHLPGMTETEAQMRRLTNAPRQQTRLDRADAAVYALLDLFGLLDGQQATMLGAADVQAGSFGRAPMSAINVGAAQAPQAQPTQAAAFTFAMPGGVGRGTFT